MVTKESTNQLPKHHTSPLYYDAVPLNLINRHLKYLILIHLTTKQYASLKNFKEIFASISIILIISSHTCLPSTAKKYSSDYKLKDTCICSCIFYPTSEWEEKKEKGAEKIDGNLNERESPRVGGMDNWKVDKKITNKLSRKSKTKMDTTNEKEKLPPTYKMTNSRYKTTIRTSYENSTSEKQDQFYHYARYW